MNPAAISGDHSNLLLNYIDPSEVRASGMSLESSGSPRSSKYRFTLRTITDNKGNSPLPSYLDISGLSTLLSDWQTLPMANGIVTIAKSELHLEIVE